jgi:hypothetical protein
VIESRDLHGSAISGGGAELKEVESVSIVESVILSGGTAVRIGPSADQPIANILIRDVDVVRAARGIDIRLERIHGARVPVRPPQGALADTRPGIERLVFRDMTMSLSLLDDLDDAGRAFSVVNQQYALEPLVRDILFDRVRTNTFLPVRVEGREESPVADVKFWGVRLLVEPVATASPEEKHLFHFVHCTAPQARFVYVTSLRGREQTWSDELFSLAHTTGLKAQAEEIFQLSPGEREP